MVEIVYNDTSFSCADGETVLDTLLRHEADIPYSCKMGTCLSCRVKAIRGDVPEQARKNIRPSLAEQGYFLACQCPSAEGLSITSGDDAVLYGRASVQRVDKMAPDICRVTLRPSTPLYYRAGQFINIRRADGLVRSYSLASVPRLDKDLEIHVKRLPRGQMSNWLFDDVGPGDALDIEGPNGDCFYVPGTPNRNLLLIGTGTGLAPLMGVVRDALDAGHTGGVHLYHGSREPDGLYRVDELSVLAQDHGNFHYVPCVSGDDVPAGFRAGRADVAAFDDNPDLSGWSAYICGYPAMVHEAKKTALKAGVPIPHIHADPFDFKDLRTAPREDETPRPDGW